MDNQTLETLYRELLRIRVIEEGIAEEYHPADEMRCPVHLCVGQEAVAVGVCSHLTESDYAFSTHRSHGHYLAKGGDLKLMMAEIYGKATGCCGGKGGSMHVVDPGVGFLGATPIVGSTIPIAVGAAFGSAMRSEDRVTVTFFGEGATEEGVFSESLNFASLRRVPVLFVCENNLYSVYSPMHVRQPESRDICAIAEAHGVPSDRGDGNNVVDVYERAGRAVERVRGGEGPQLLLLDTYRWREHCGPEYDNDLGYREESEFAQWRACCPLDRLTEDVLRQGALTRETVEDFENEAKREFAEALAFAKESPFPEASALCSQVYAP